ncbi:right-handed parallel beta-helix repeat-containing protein [Kribbella antibiotica]|uniref:Right-handed parallel beta-helix repeat-containing protein n=1 Tax=Kribbella antibiotica TaxID=190195 RepID=A0A4R4YRT3_9ACTN|nr:right-handed parallel beta-helix repeat-containing protein [Kribbella antibiotica]TDD47340.1 right-handed parallel beta-helix repeat-containing protein [Kribbella antibiotica]
MKRRKVAGLSIAGLMVLGLPLAIANSADAAGRTLTVAKSGGQYSTIQAAANASQPGDTILISAGTYQESLKPKSGASGQEITYQAAPGARVVLDGNKSLKSGNGLLNLDGKSWLKFDGIAVTKSPTHGVYGSEVSHITFTRCEVSSSSNGGLVLLSGSDLVVDGCDIHHNNDKGTSADNEAISIGWSTRFVVKNNYVHDNGEEGIDAKYNDNAAGLILNNVVANNRGPNIYVDSSSGVEVNGNTSYGAKESTKAGIAVAVEDYSESRKAQNIKILNNVSAKNAGGGISFWKESSGTISGISIINNTLANNPKPGIVGASEVSGSGNVVRNTIFAANSTGIGGPFSSEKNLTSDPGFVDPSNGDYKLKATATAAIDAGSATNAPPTDRDGGARPVGNGFDIGAYEYGSTGPTPTPTPTPTPPTGDWDPRQPGPNELFTGADGSANYFRSEIGANPRLDSNSAAIVNSIGSNTPKLNGPDWQITVFTASNSDPVYHPEFSEDWGCSVGDGIHIPDNATRELPGVEDDDNADSWIVVYNKDDKTVKSIWGATKAGGTWKGYCGGTWPAASGGGTESKISGVGTGAEVQAGAGFILNSEIATGAINHALYFTSTKSCGNFRKPAGKSDGHTSGSSCVPMGARLQLDPSVNCAGLSGASAGEKMICVTMQKYGGYVLDSGGPGPISGIGVAGDDLTDPNRSPWQTPGNGMRSGGVLDKAGLGAGPLSHIPWNKLRVLATWNGQ